jgi:hypothetical protein
MMNRSLLARRTTQSGAVLMIGMVMLIMLTLVALAVIRLSTRHTQVVNNEQLRSEATAAANYALDSVLNVPAAAWTGYKGAGQTQYVNLGVTQTADTTATSMQVAVKNLTCKRGRVIKNSELMATDPVTHLTNVKDPLDKPCIFTGGGGHLTIIPSGTSGDSLCATVLWDVQAQADDPKLLAASVPVTQGVEVRADVATYVDACK